MNPAMDETEYQRFLQEAEEWDAHCSEMADRIDGSPAVCCPKPIPCDPYGEESCLNAWGLFTPGVLARIIYINRAWLQDTPHTTKEVLRRLFPRFDAAGMTTRDILQRISNSLHEAGYSPSNQTPNPTWTFPV